MNLDRKHIISIISGYSDKNILVIGDIIMDAYFWGKTDRISPEAPVPIVDVDKTNFNPGGAGNVALNLSTLGAKVSIMAMVGNDSNGDTLLTQLNDQGIDTSFSIVLDNYQTPIKTRVIAQDQQIVRIDQENSSTDLYSRSLKIKLDNKLKRFDGIILADYNKGLLSKSLIESIIKIAKEYSIPIYVDPKKDNFFEYNCVKLFKPNSAEFKEAIGSDYSEDNIVSIGKNFRIKYKSEILLITRGAKEALLFTKDGNETIPTITQSVHDVSGAGDTVISVFALSDLCGASPIESASIANIAAGIVCSKVGVVPVHSNELKSKILD